MVLLLAISLFGCSNNNQENTTNQLLSNIKAIDANTLEITLSNGDTATITDFTPQPLEFGKETKVTFTYKEIVYNEKVVYGDLFIGTIQRIDTGFEKNGSISVLDNNNIATANNLSTSSSSNNDEEFAYITGQDINY